ncbi:hypothetical protein BSKO_13607 [Bryopsis sp. KO-2023]|nr:hypothetical protein BSKO_13607 [Bryopsis sp. KO-2023]
MASVAYKAMMWIATFATLLGGFQYGYALGIMNTMLDYVGEDLSFDVTLSGAIIGSAVLLGAAAGAVAGGHFADRLGTKRAQIYNTFIFVIGGVMCSCSPPTGLSCLGMKIPLVLLLGRLVVGFASGASSLYTPRLLAEISPPHLRGLFGASFQILLNVGILASYVIGLPYESTPGARVQVFNMDVAWWRVMFACGIAPAVVQWFLLLVVPESPVWLDWKGDFAAADTSRRSFWTDMDEAGNSETKSDNTEPLLVESKKSSINNIELGLDIEAFVDAPLGSAALFERKYRWMVALAVGVPLLAQLSGINTVVFYSSQVFATAGVKSPILGSIYTGLVNVIFTIVSSVMLDRYGRRPLLLWSHGGMCISILGLALASSSLAAGSWASSMALPLVLLYVMFFAMGAGPVPWIYLSEILPENIKGFVAGFATAQCWIANLLIVLTFPSMLNAIHLFGSYVLYSGLNLVALLFAFSLVVETKQRSLRDIANKLLLK